MGKTHHKLSVLRQDKGDTVKGIANFFHILCVENVLIKD